MNRTLPVAVIGAGPVGLAAAVHLIAAGEEPLILEAGAGVGSAVREWGHVRLFSPWAFNIDRVAANLLAREGWTYPEPNTHPTGAELVRDYLEPLSEIPVVRQRLHLGTRVTAVTRAVQDKMKTQGREMAPFRVRIANGSGERDVFARAVIDASGTWMRPNPLGAAGIPAIGERKAADRVAYRIPDVLGAQRVRYAGRRVLVVGSGHSAFNVLTDLVRLAREEPSTQVSWAVRRPTLGQVFGGGENDALVERGRLGSRVRRLVDDGAVRLFTGVHVERVERTASGSLTVIAGGKVVADVDEVVALTGFRPDLSLLSELRLSLDPALESPTALAPLIDPNVHSCGDVPPHGADELGHPEPDLYVVGMKSYGRAPTALMLTGYEQVRSVVAALTGDWDSARDVHLELPQTGVCSVPQSVPQEEPAPSCGLPVAVGAGPVGAGTGAGCG